MDLDTQTGIDAIKIFHNSSVRFSAYGKSWDDLKSIYGNKFEIYAEGVGLAINSTGASRDQVEEAMIDLASAAKGRIPKDHQEYIKAIAGQVSQISYIDLSKTVAKETIVAVGDGLVKVGESVKTTLSWVLTLLPYLVIGGIVFYIYSFGKNNSTISAGAMADLKDMAKAAKAKVKKAIGK